jgi:hypothetical protein
LHSPSPPYSILPGLFPIHPPTKTTSAPLRTPSPPLSSNARRTTSTTHNVSQERSATPQLAFPTAAADKTTDAFPSSAAFDAINASLSSDDAGRKDAIKKGGAVFAFTLKNAAGDTDSWHIDLKEKGCVGKGDAPEGGKANGEYSSCPASLLHRT